MATVVVNIPERSRFELQIDGEKAGTAVYRIEGNTIEFLHTVIEDSHRGQGLASTLVSQAFDRVRAETTFRVIPTCPYIRTWLPEHPEYQDLLTR